jgi:dTDP-glucose pyrophosphorylase
MKFKDIRIISSNTTVGKALNVLNALSEDLILFIVNDEDEIVGTFTDGDFRRGILKGLTIEDSVNKFMNSNFKYINKNKFDIDEILSLKKQGLKVIPVLDNYKHILQLINFSFYKSYLPLDAIIMAGGEGLRLRPLTELTPKPLLKVGNKPILEHLIDRLIKYGINNYHVSINYLGQQIINYFKDGSDKNINIKYIDEKIKSGTIGAVSNIEDFDNQNVLVLNSDILTNINFEDFYNHFVSNNSDLSIACVPYSINIPYAILDTNGIDVVSLNEKPSFNYVTNAGIYLIKKEHLKKIPKNTFFNATDLVEDLITKNYKVTYFTILDYWLDIGKIDDFNKAQLDINNLEL